MRLGLWLTRLVHRDRADEPLRDGPQQRDQLVAKGRELGLADPWHLAERDLRRRAPLGERDHLVIGEDDIGRLAVAARPIVTPLAQRVVEGPRLGRQVDARVLGRSIGGRMHTIGTGARPEREEQGPRWIALAHEEVLEQVQDVVVGAERVELAGVEASIGLTPPKCHLLQLHAPRPGHDDIAILGRTPGEACRIAIATKGVAPGRDRPTTRTDALVPDPRRAAPGTRVGG